MMSAVIVWGTLGAAAAFCLAYGFSPRLRADIEQPKHRFLAQVQAFDKTTVSTTQSQERAES